MNTIAYILAEFPSQTETFILKEALYVNESIPLYIIALKKGKTPIDNDVQMAFESRIIYIPPWWSWKVLPIGSVFSYTVAEQSRSMTHNPLKTLVMAGLNRHPLSYLQIFRQLKVWLIASFVSKMIKKLKIQHMHAHFANYPTDVAMLVSHLSGIPFSFSAHAHDIYVNPTNLPSKIHKATFVTTCTDYNKKHLAAIVPPVDQVKIHLVYHGVETVK